MGDSTKKKKAVKKKAVVRKAIKLNLGAGDQVLDGYTSIDRKNGQNVYPLKGIEDGSVDDIYASHVLEHFSHRQVCDVVKHWVEKLKPGGRLRIAVPDFLKITHAYDHGEPQNTQGYVMGGQVDENDFHRCLFDREVLTELMAHAGLERIGFWNAEFKDCSALPISLNLQGYKPNGTERPHGDVTAIMSVPRMGPIMHQRISQQALNRAGVMSQMGQGAYWHQVLSEMIEDHIKRPGIDFIITADYDSIFTEADVCMLYRLIRAYDDMDALVALQSKRGSEFALFGMVDANGKPRAKIYSTEFDHPITPIRTGHFGLTIFRTATLRKFTRPWFMPKPAPDGTWGDKKVDADVAFWLKWYEQGFKLGLASHVVIGHLQELIVWPDKNFKAIYQPVMEYDQYGMPAEAAR
jgi:predicted SAM-dependent methyltransferase